MLNAASDAVSFRPQYVERPIRPLRTRKEPSAAADGIVDTSAAVAAEGQEGDSAAAADGQNNAATVQQEAIPLAPVTRPPAPSSWANLFAKTPVAQVIGTNGNAADEASSIAADSDAAAAATEVIGAPFVKPSTSSVVDAINAYRVKAPEAIPFLEPRGLINTGNMCYMNSVR